MKLRYYLRGVGVGLILAVVVYSTMIIPRKYRMTDEEIMERARELGMVSQENPDVDLSALSGTPSPPGDATPVPSGEENQSPEGDENTTPIPSGEENQSPEGDGNTTPVPSGEENQSPEGDENTTPVPSGEENQSPDGADIMPPSAPNAPDKLPVPEGSDIPTIPAFPEQDPIEPLPGGEQGSSSENDSAVSITITPGMGSETFAFALQEAGLVEDAADFDRYLMQNNYALYIRPGTYRILPGTTYEEIAKRVTAN